MPGLLRRTRPTRGAVIAAVVTPVMFASVDGGHLAALPPHPGPRGPRTAEQAAIESTPVCIGSTIASAGALSDVLYYRAVASDDGRVTVGYFAFFSEERPWGNNWLTWTLAPALAVDLVYSRALLFAPGLQRALYGAGDVEGVEVVYQQAPDGTLRLEQASAEDRSERTVPIAWQAAYAIDPERPTFYTDVWSHQLGAGGARSRADLAYVRCYAGDTIRPLPESVARSFRLEKRARPAHVERQAGRRVDQAAPGDGRPQDADATLANVRAPRSG